ncbi:hypothetical protein D3C79_919240 [compost metagenome]
MKIEQEAKPGRLDPFRHDECPFQIAEAAGRIVPDPQPDGIHTAVPQNIQKVCSLSGLRAGAVPEHSAPLLYLIQKRNIHSVDISSSHHQLLLH